MFGMLGQVVVRIQAQISLLKDVLKTLKSQRKSLSSTSEVYSNNLAIYPFSCTS